MLIYFFSDRNYIRQGFYAKYNVTDCAFDCNSATKRGVCDSRTHSCHCQSGFTGEACEIATCPDFCSGHGTCNFDFGQCDCDEGFAGHDCRLAMRSNKGQSTWFLVAPEGTGFLARAGHAGVFVKSMNSLFIFGGNSLNHIFSDFVYFDFTMNSWQEVLPRQGAPWPSARHNHAMVAHENKIYLYGGSLTNDSHSDELWCYDFALQQWSLRALNSSVRPKAVASHTLTLVDDQWLYLFGGRTDLGAYISDMYRIQLHEDAEWEHVMARGGKVANRRLVGHTTVYHPESRSLLVFGGFLPDYARFPKRTNALHAYHVVENYWSQIHFMKQDDGSEAVHYPKDRAFHSAAILGNYMVIYGGNSHIHHSEEVCYDYDIYFYHLGCHRWLNHVPLEDAFPGGPNAVHRGRFSHVAVPAFGNTILITGGYKGSVLGDLIAYTVPLAIAQNEVSLFFIVVQYV